MKGSSKDAFNNAKSTERMRKHQNYIPTELQQKISELDNLAKTDKQKTDIEVLKNEHSKELNNVNFNHYIRSRYFLSGVLAGIHRLDQMHILNRQNEAQKKRISKQTIEKASLQFHQNYKLNASFKQASKTKSNDLIK